MCLHLIANLSILVLYVVCFKHVFEMYHDYLCFDCVSDGYSFKDLKRCFFSENVSEDKSFFALRP